MNKPNQSSIFSYAVINGQRQPVSQVQLSLFNKAILASFGVYEAVKVDRGRPFYLEEHLRRLQRSAEMVDLGLQIDWQTLVGWFEDLQQIDPQATWRLFIIAVGAVDPTDHAIVAMRPERLPTYPLQFYKEGAQAVLYEGQRALPACKSLNTLVNFLARRLATQQGALEGLLYHNGHLTEGARSNLFAVRQGQLLTPPASEVLSGITRDIIVQVMEGTDHPVVETSVIADASLYEEIFITSTSMHVMPITHIDGRPVGSGRVGPITRLAMSQFETHYRQVMRDE